MSEFEKWLREQIITKERHYTDQERWIFEHCLIAYENLVLKKK